ncbi:unnamed protein product [Nesidiocoris tenuis]|uniref:Uncharacterized protein n=1 Tax=Nesidiocoris tenuis TaxID=355587 RepID=A0A6H5G766_9HEMI|nr:unnamed protein product [Nesidiocoris tenuis]
MRRISPPSHSSPLQNRILFRQAIRREYVLIRASGDRPPVTHPPPPSAASSSSASTNRRSSDRRTTHELHRPKSGKV